MKDTLGCSKNGDLAWVLESADVYWNLSSGNSLVFGLVNKYRIRISPIMAALIEPDMIDLSLTEKQPAFKAGCFVVSVNTINQRRRPSK